MFVFRRPSRSQWDSNITSTETLFSLEQITLTFLTISVPSGAPNVLIRCAFGPSFLKRSPQILV